MSVEMNRVMITGTTGFIGSHLAEELIARGVEVYGISRGVSAEILPSLSASRNFRWLKIDLRDRKQVVSALRIPEFDAVFHTASYLPPSRKDCDPVIAFEVNALGTMNLLEACRRADVAKVIVSSSMAVYGDPTHLPVNEEHRTQPEDFYGASKLAAEAYCRAHAQTYGVRAVALRYANVFGPRKNKGAVFNFIKAVLKGNPPIILNGHETLDLVYVKDVVQANLYATLSSGIVRFEAFNIGSGVETSVRSLAARVISLTGSELSLIDRTQHDAPKRRFFYDISKASRYLSFNPRSLDEALSEFITWIRNNSDHVKGHTANSQLATGD